MILFTTQISNFNLIPKKKTINTKAWRLYLKSFLLSNRDFVEKLSEKYQEEAPIESSIKLSFLIHHSNKIGNVQGYIDVVSEGLQAANIIKDKSQITPILDNCTIKRDNKDRVCITLSEVS